MGGFFMRKLFIVFALLISPVLFAQEDADVGFHNFSWGTSMQDFTARVGTPAHIDEVNGMQSLVYDNMIVSGYQAFMVVYFSQNGLEGGTYYFHTFSYEELVNCYTDVQSELIDKYGPTLLSDIIFRELRPYETSWNLKNGYIYLRVNTRLNEPVTLWYSSPALTRILLGS